MPLVYFLFLILLGAYVGWAIYNRKNHLRVLMYHKVDAVRTDMLTVTTIQIEAHLQYLQKHDYQIVTIKKLLSGTPWKPKSVLIAFDDAYLNNLTYAYPILKKYNAPATIFVPSNYVGGSSDWDALPEPLMSIKDLQNLDKSIYDLALHTHTHPSLAGLSTEQISHEIAQNIAFFEQNQLAYMPALAYPYGRRPKSAAARKAMQNALLKLNIRLGFRIGNRLNHWPLAHPFEIQRIDIRGTDSLETFKRKVKWGKIF
jgi:peptidoglycan/xylan/chitin deacetylase (PgdA/CDA1 family)